MRASASRPPGALLALLIGVVLAALGAQPARAQIYAPGQFGVAGYPLTCGSVATGLDPTLSDWARAQPGIILLNPLVFAQLPPAVQVFVYAHECAHEIGIADEGQADCWAAMMGRQQGWLQPGDLRVIAWLFGQSPGDWTHAPGPLRVGNILGCYRGW